MGGGALHVCVKGNMEVSRIEISDELMDTENKEDLQDMLIVCLNQALQQAKDEKDRKMQSMTSGISTFAGRWCQNSGTLRIYGIGVG